MQRETLDTEYIEQVTDTFLKTVSAFSNGEGGVITFGITDDQKVVGLSNPERAALQIENKINDSIQPLPQYRIHIDTENKTVSLQISEGPFNPYYWRNKAYIRHNSSSVEMDMILNS
ncbi:ATP-binding protein [Erysipelotrichaceae bacterium 51-3]